jgi:hypothetical protein
MSDISASEHNIIDIQSISSQYIRSYPSTVFEPNSNLSLKEDFLPT